MRSLRGARSVSARLAAPLCCARSYWQRVAPAGFEVVSSDVGSVYGGALSEGEFGIAVEARLSGDDRHLGCAKPQEASGRRESPSGRKR